MPDYPPDIMEKARECALLSWGPNLTLSETFAEAILAERQRCAEVARARVEREKELAQKHKNDPYAVLTRNDVHCYGITEAMQIADAIMNPEPSDDQP